MDAADDDDDAHALSLRRRTLLPPITPHHKRRNSSDSLEEKLDNLFLPPGGVGERTPQPERRKREFAEEQKETTISPTHSASFRYTD